MKKIFSLSLLCLLSLVLFAGAVNAADVDVVTAASVSDNPAAFAKALGEEGTWIVCATTDMTFNSELVIAGEFHNKGDESRELYHKVGPYAQDDDHNVTERYTITAPQFTVKSPNTKFQGGIFAGDVYVEANGFTVDDATVQGNVYFAKDEYKESFVVEDGGKVTGVTEVKPDVDIISAASITGDEAAFAKTLGEEGTWIIAALNDLTYNQELVIAGEFHNKGDESRDLYRKLAPYAQDEDHNVTERYTITAPQFVVKSPNTKFQGGIFVGNVLVGANGFTVDDATVEGNVYFASEEYKESFVVEDGGKVTGVTQVVPDIVSSASVNEE